MRAFSALLWLFAVAASSTALESQQQATYPPYDFGILTSQQDTVAKRQDASTTSSSFSHAPLFPTTSSISSPTPSIAGSASTPPIILTGLGTQDGVARVRREVRQMQQDTDLWTLYLLALSMLQHLDEGQDESFYGIAGIHGVPFQPWNGVQSGAGDPNTGYCTHHSVLFPPWHRTYMSLYEQIVCSRVTYIATLYSTTALRTRYTSAATRCSIPYFDWAATPPDGQSVLPASIGDTPTIPISGPNGAQVIANPLYSYTFRPPSPSLFLNVTPWSLWGMTLRGPTTLTNKAVSNNSEVASQLDAALVGNQQRLYNLFSSYDNYTTFSNEGWIPTGDSGMQYDSLESLHDNVHYILGGGMGHMSIVPFSSFDPIFWLHHAQIDRIFAMWQALHPKRWVEPGSTTLASFTTPQGEVVDRNTPLTPFWKSGNGTFWTSDGVRDTRALGYTYPELVNMTFFTAGNESFPYGNGTLGSSSSPTSGAETQAWTQAQKQLMATINRLYGSSSVATAALALSGSLRKRSWNDTTDASNVQFHAKPRVSLQVVRKVVNNKGQYREWNANIKVDKQVLGGPFSVQLVLDNSSLLVTGDAEEDIPQQFNAGQMNVFAAPNDFMTLRASAQSMDHIITSTIPLTATLLDLISSHQLSSLDTDDVQSYLKATLHTAIVRGDGSTVEQGSSDWDAVKNAMNITIVSAQVTVPKTVEELPKWKEPDCVFEINM